MKVESIDDLLDLGTAIPETGCFIWLLGSATGEYDAIQWKSKSWQVDRLAYLLNGGKDPERKIVCHKCGTPACFNPRHLFVDLNKDNMLDTITKVGR